MFQLSNADEQSGAGGVRGYGIHGDVGILSGRYGGGEEDDRDGVFNERTGKLEDQMIMSGSTLE